MKYRFQGKIKAIKFGDSRVSILLEDTTFLSNEGDWKQWTDWKLVETGKYKKGEVWVSAFEQSAPEVFQACKIIEKGSEVEVDIFKTEKGFLNINNIRLGVPDVDVNEDLKPPDMPEPTRESTTSDTEDTGKIMAEIEATAKDVLIVRQTCIKAVGAGMRFEKENDAEVAVAIAKRLETYALTGK